MGELVHSLGIEWKVLIAQIINFAILFYVLKRFAVGPIMKILDKRFLRMESDRAEAEKIESKVADMEKEKEAILIVAREESQKIIKNAEAVAAKLRTERVAAAEKEVAAIVAAGKKQLADETKNAETVLRREMGSLIAIAVEKTVAKAMDKKAHEYLVEEARQVL